MKMSRTAQRTMQILTYISQHPAGADLDAICEALSLPKTSAYDILTTLVGCNMLQIVYGQKKLYQLAMGIYQIGMQYRNNLNYTKAFEQPLRELALALNKTAFFALAHHTNIVYLLKFEPPQPIITTGKLGGMNPMYCTALGKAMMSQLSLSEQTQLIGEMDMVAKTQNTITQPHALLKELEVCRARGYAVDFRELEEHGLCVAAPVFDADGSVLGAISVSDLYRPEEDVHAVGERVKQVAAHLSALCGYQGGHGTLLPSTVAQQILGGA